MLQPIPENICARYDVVHVGLLVFVVQHDDPIPVLENLLKLLSKSRHLAVSSSGYESPRS